MVDHETKALQYGLHNALCSAASGVQKSFVDFLEFVDRSLSLIAGLSICDESAKPGLRLRSL